MTTKNYNRIFLQLTRSLRRDGVNPENLRVLLAQQKGESSEWPNDDAFKEAWRTQQIYKTLNNPKIVYLLRRLNDIYTSAKMESIAIDGALTVEHLLPQEWIASWPLPDGSKGIKAGELWNADQADLSVVATRNRNRMLQTIGNLTILTQPLNSSVSNSAWNVKRPELMRHSLLPINQQLYDVNLWDEVAIEARTDELFARALILWPSE